MSRIAGRPRVERVGSATRGARATVVLLVALGAVMGLPDAKARESSNLCASAQVLVQSRNLTSAVRLFDRARTAGQACGSGAEARAARETASQAQASLFRGMANEAEGDDEAALEAYVLAARTNAEQVEAIAAIARLTGTASVLSPTATPTPTQFGAAEELNRLGRRKDAEDAALSAVKAGATPPAGSVAEDLLSVSVIEKGRTRLADWWPYLLVALLLAAAFVVRLSTSKLGRRARNFPLLGLVLPPLRLAVDAKTATGVEPDLSLGFATRVRAQLHELDSRLEHDPRVVQGTDAPVEVPLGEVPTQAKVVIALWRWVARSNTVTLRATLLPAASGGLGCHVVLVEQNGTPTRRVRASQQVLVHRPDPWDFNPRDKEVVSLYWMPLVTLTSAWALFAFRSIQVGELRLSEEFGTAHRGAYGELLAGIEAREAPLDAARHYRSAIALDPGFREAYLNLAALKANGDANDLKEAEELLRRRVLPGLPEPRTARRALSREGTAEARQRALWYRARYSLAIVRINRLTPILGNTVPPPLGLEDEVLSLLKELDELRTKLGVDIEPWERLLVAKAES